MAAKPKLEISLEEKKGESSSQTDEDEEKERTPNSDISHILESEDESGVAEFIHRYSVEIISENKDKNEPNLILHWAVGRKSPGEWTRPDDSHLPGNSKRMPDNIAV